MSKKPSYEGNEWVTTSVIAGKFNYSPVYFIQKAKKLEKDGVFIYGEHFFKSSSHHHFDQFRSGKFLDRFCLNELTILQHGHNISNSENFFETMGYINNRHSSVNKGLNDVKKLL